MNAKHLSSGSADGASNLIEHALNSLEKTISRPIERRFPSPKGNAGVNLELRLGGRWHAFVCLVYPLAKETSHLGLLTGVAKNNNALPLLIASHVKPEFADQCVQEGIQFLDLAGNAYLNVPGQSIFVIGRRLSKGVALSAKNASGRAAAASSTGLKIIYLLLCVHEAIHWTYREIASAADVSLGAVGTVLQALDAHHLISMGRNVSKPRLLDVPALVDEWIVNYPLKLRPKLNGQRFTAQTLPPPEATRLPEGRAWWGGGVAAAMWGADVINPQERIIYVRSESRSELLMSLAKQYRLRPAVDGEIEILDAFWNLSDEVQNHPAVPPMLVISDLLLSRDPRDKEAARWLQKEFDWR